MEMNEQWGLPDVKAVLPHAYNPNIRFFTVAKSAANCPQQDVKGTWVSCDAANLQTFSAAAYFFWEKAARFAACAYRFDQCQLGWHTGRSVDARFYYSQG